jgi:thioredoxin-like negative regulator of GroEL
MKPIVHGLAGKYRDRISFLYVDIGDRRSSDIKRRLGFRSTPHFVLLAADGRQVADSTGVIAAADFEQWFTSQLLDDRASAP